MCLLLLLLQQVARECQLRADVVRALSQTLPPFASDGLHESVHAEIQEDVHAVVVGLGADCNPVHESFACGTSPNSWWSRVEVDTRSPIPQCGS